MGVETAMCMGYIGSQVYELRQKVKGQLYVVDREYIRIWQEKMPG
jgi:hypothetical protein